MIDLLFEVLQTIAIALLAWRVVRPSPAESPTLTEVAQAIVRHELGSHGRGREKLRQRLEEIRAKKGLQA